MSDSLHLTNLKTCKSDTYRPIDASLVSSNLAAPTPKNPSYSRKKGIFLTSENTVSDTKVRYERKPLTNAKGYPYRKARLVGDDITKEWHIVFYAWDIGLNKLVRKRVGK